MGRPHGSTPALPGGSCVGRDAIALQVWLQDFGNENAAVSLLIILDDRYPGPANGQSATVDRVKEVSLRLATLISNLRTPRLKCVKVRAGRDFLVGVLSWKPDFNVVSFGRAKSRIARRKHHAPEGQFKPLQHVFGIARKLLVFVFALLRTRELDEFDLLKLMLAN